MIFNDTATKTGILQNTEIKLFGDEGYGQITGDANRLYQFTDRANRALDRFAFLAMSADGRWQWDDNNYVDISIGTTSLVSGQRNYTFALEHLEVEKVLVLNASGEYSVLKSIDASDPDAVAYLENNAGRSGTPTQYDKRGDTIFLDFTPNYSIANGLKIYFKRGASYFVYTDTTKAPGFASIFHKFVPMHMSAMYAVDRTMPEAKNYVDLLQMEEKDIKQFYSARSKDERPTISTSYQNNK